MHLFAYSVVIPNDSLFVCQFSCPLHFLTEAFARNKILYYKYTTTVTFSCSKTCRYSSSLRPQKGPSRPITGLCIDSCTVSPSNLLIYTKRNERAAIYTSPQ